MDVPIQNDNFAEKRYEICKQCEHLTSLKFCDVCNCFMPAKTKTSWVKCPIDKWGIVQARKD